MISIPLKLSIVFIAHLPFLLIGRDFICQTDKTITEKGAVVSSSSERTCALIKPDAVAAFHVGEIISLIERNKFSIVHIKKIYLSREQAQTFYAEHKGKPFYETLVGYMTSGPIYAFVLEHTNAIAQWRKLMGATDPQQAEIGTIRKMFGVDKTYNAVHGSDSAASAEREIAFFFGTGS